MLTFVVLKATKLFRNIKLAGMQVATLVNKRFEEQELISRLITGDSKAYRYLIDTHRSRVYNTLVGMLKHTEDAEDLTQEVFIEVFRSIANFRGQSRLSTWLYRVAISKALELKKYNGRKKRFAFVVSIFTHDGTALKYDAAHYYHPGVQLEEKERTAMVLKAISKLPALQSTAFKLHKIDNLSYAEVAEEMQTSVPAVESLIHRAKVNLQKHLGSYYKHDKN